MEKKTFCFMISAAIVIILLSGCTIQPSGKEISAKIGEPFNLSIGQSAFIQSENLKITLLNVTEDSRCPTGVECIWAGQAGVLVNIEKGGENLGDFKLIASSKNSTQNFDGYEVRLKVVEPYPREGENIKPEDYKVWFVVYRN